MSIINFNEIPHVLKIIQIYKLMGASGPLLTSLLSHACLESYINHICELPESLQKIC